MVDLFVSEKTIRRNASYKLKWDLDFRVIIFESLSLDENFDRRQIHTCVGV